MLFFGSKKIPIEEFFPKNFVDIHSHFLPGIDDGAKDLETSIELILKMKSYGIKNIITTPHVLGNVYPNTSAIITQKLQEVQQELVKRNITDITLHAAAEYMMDEKFPELVHQKELLTLKNNLVLVEMSYYSPPINLYDMLFEMQLQGYKPVLAHPERYISYHKNYKEYQKLKASGCYFQLNLLSLTGYYGHAEKEISKLLLKDDFFDFVGTDAHHHKHLEQLVALSTKTDQKLIGKLLENNIQQFGKS